MNILIIFTDGLVFASWLFLISVGLTLVFGVLRILNMAHGSLYTIGAYTGASLVIAYVGRRWPMWGSYLVLVSAALLVGAVMGPLIERGFLRQVYGRDPNSQLLLTYALFLILEDATKLLWGVTPYYASEPYGWLGQVQVGTIAYPAYSLLVMALAGAAGGALWLFMNKTPHGRVLIGVIHDPEISAAMGVNVGRAFVLAFSLGAFLAALGGAFTAPLTAVLPGMAVEVIVLAFAVIAIGGLGSLEGAVLGALLVGIVRAAMIHLFPVLELFTIYLVMALVLLLRPQGLFARHEVRRI